MKKIQNTFKVEGETERSGLDLLRNFSQPTTFVSGVLLFVIARTENIWMGYIG